MHETNLNHIIFVNYTFEGLLVKVCKQFKLILNYYILSSIFYHTRTCLFFIHFTWLLSVHILQKNVSHSVYLRIIREFSTSSLNFYPLGLTTHHSTPTSLNFPNTKNLLHTQLKFDYLVFYTSCVGCPKKSKFRLNNVLL
jgi:hypothetical protein